MEAVLQFTPFRSISIRPFVSRKSSTTVGVISVVDAVISKEDLMKGISAAKNMLQVRRFLSSLSVKIVFAGNLLSTHVKVGMVRYLIGPKRT